jgi:hypothetical protein
VREVTGGFIERHNTPDPVMVYARPGGRFTVELSNMNAHTVLLAEFDDLLEAGRYADRVRLVLDDLFAQERGDH